MEMGYFCQMFRNRENICFINIDAIIVLTILFLGLLMFNNTLRTLPVHQSTPYSTYVTINNNTAISTPCIRVQVFQKTWILNNDNFNLLAFNRNPLLDSKKERLKVSQYQFIRQSSDKIPQFILRYHLFPLENDPFPVLS
jgi:hypothetical protein